MTQEDLVRLFFAKGEKLSGWEFCFNEQCPLAKECARQISVAYKPSELTRGYAIYPDAYRDGKCQHFMQLRMVKTAWGFEKILDELKKRDEASFRLRMTSYLGSGTSYYRYKLGQLPLLPGCQQYIQSYLQERGYEGLKFDKYTEEITPVVGEM